MYYIFVTFCLFCRRQLLRSITQEATLVNNDQCKSLSKPTQKGMYKNVESKDNTTLVIDKGLSDTTSYTHNTRTHASSRAHMS